MEAPHSNITYSYNHHTASFQVWLHESIVCDFRCDCTAVTRSFWIPFVHPTLGIYAAPRGLIHLLKITFNLPLDWISFIFMLWNLTAVGLVQIFWKGKSTNVYTQPTGPMIMQQAYLVLISSLMAYSLTQTLELTTWILLSLLAIWDLIAVLCPFGPLRLLVESSREQEREIPALLYSGIHA